MTKEEIKALIDTKIAGQGSAVDAGSALPAILNGILELAATPPARKVIEITKTFQDVSIENALTKIKINGAQVSSFSELEPYLETGTIINYRNYSNMEIVVRTDGGGSIYLMGGFFSSEYGEYFQLTLNPDENLNTFQFDEV